MKKFLGLAAAAVMSSVALTGCGGGSDEYCSSLEGAEEQFGSLEGGDFAEFDEALSTFRDLADEAPSEVEEEWETLVGAIDGFEAALDEAGVSFSDLGGIESGELPEGVDQDALVEALGSVEELSTEEVTSAGDAIEEHAESECDVSLS